jgi:hypothetical protein
LPRKSSEAGVEVIWNHYRKRRRRTGESERVAG